MVGTPLTSDVPVLGAASLTMAEVESVDGMLVEDMAGAIVAGCNVVMTGEVVDAAVVTSEAGARLEEAVVVLDVMDDDDRITDVACSKLVLAGSKATAAGPALSPVPTPESGTPSASTGVSGSGSGATSSVASSAGKNAAVPAVHVPALVLATSVEVDDVPRGAAIGVAYIGEAVDVGVAGAQFILANPFSVIFINRSSLRESARMATGSGSTKGAGGDGGGAMKLNCHTQLGENFGFPN
ncbi:hypothetical protein BS78_09G029000 [Paspalum vaginatum]|nr:hypothetical protein BS78_09G029000 [Paspalum vaginatum]